MVLKICPCSPDVSDCPRCKQRCTRKQKKYKNASKSRKQSTNSASRKNVQVVKK